MVTFANARAVKISWCRRALAATWKISVSPRISAFAPYLLLAALSLFWGLNWPGMKEDFFYNESTT